MNEDAVEFVSGYVEASLSMEYDVFVQIEPGPYSTGGYMHLTNAQAIELAQLLMAKATDGEANAIDDEPLRLEVGARVKSDYHRDIGHGTIIREGAMHSGNWMVRWDGEITNPNWEVTDDGCVEFSSDYLVLVAGPATEPRRSAEDLIKEMREARGGAA